MFIDVSEVKSFRNCKRQWKFTSRNGYHMKSRVPAPALQTGTLFHNCLHKLYLGASLDSVLEWLSKEMDPSTDMCLKPMIRGYYTERLIPDLEHFQVLDIEHKFVLPTGMTADSGEDINLTGSIDMICLDTDDNAIYAFEHKTASRFRENTYLWMDEQPRLYYRAMMDYVEEYNAKHQTTCTLGGVYINEVRKLLRQFDSRRTLCTYSKEDITNFMRVFLKQCAMIGHACTEDYAEPKPDWMKCGMCDYADVCCTYMYANIPKSVLETEFGEQFVEREYDHLEEKPEVSTE
jgi:uncharacterized protein YuzB (UPF0349 family)